MKGPELVHQARLEGVYGILRKVQATHNSFETACIGAGNCCKVGLLVSLGECWNIAKSLRREYWLNAESNGIDEADKMLAYTIQDLRDAFTQQADWDPNVQETEKHCAFFNSDYGCGIYEVRPMVCRAYGVIAPVQDGVCPRKRLPDGGHELIWDDSIDRMMAEFGSIIDQWGHDHPDLAYSMFMPAGVLRFLLTSEELTDLINTTDSKFWMGHPGYKHQVARENWTNVTIGRKQ